MLSSSPARTVVLCCALLTLFAASAQAATTFTPNRFDDPAVGGDNCAPPAPVNGCSLRGAVKAAKLGDTIDLASGTYTLVTAALEVKEKVTILGDGPAATKIQQTGLDRVIKAPAGLTMSGVTITGGHLVGKDGADGQNPGDEGQSGGNASGAGIEGSATIALTDVVVTGNVSFGGDGGNGANGSAGAGGKGGRGGSANGVGVTGGNLVLLRVAVTNNVGTPGDAGTGGNGGINGPGGAGGPGGTSLGAGVSSGTNITATDTLIAGNVSKTTPGGPGGDGGGLSGVGGAGGQGEAADGAGLFSNGVVKLTNVTIAGNTAWGGTGGLGGDATTATTPTSGGAGGSGFGGQGGGVALFNGASGEFASVTIAANTTTPGTGGSGGAGSTGGPGGANGISTGALAGNVFLASATLKARDTIFADGQAQAGKEDCTLNSSTLTSNGHNLVDRTGQCIAVAAAGDLLGVAAGLGPLQNNGGPTQTMALLPGSAAINGGEPSCVDAAGAPLSTDQRGLPRLSPCDIGAFEVQPVPPEPPKPPGPATPKLSKLKLTPKKIYAGEKLTIRFKLNTAARVKFTLKTRPPGAKGLIKVTSAPKAFKAAAGPNKRKWKVPARLPVGTYKLTATPVGGSAKTVAFKIVPKP